MGTTESISCYTRQVIGCLLSTLAQYIRNSTECPLTSGRPQGVQSPQEPTWCPLTLGKPQGANSPLDIAFASLARSGKSRKAVTIYDTDTVRREEIKLSLFPDSLILHPKEFAQKPFDAINTKKSPGSLYLLTW